MFMDHLRPSVLDVGAFIGDTTIYFALRGARDVVAFEPYPFPYEFALRNVQANGLGNVRVINVGVSGSDGTVGVTRGETTMGDELKPSEEPDAVEVPVYSLDRVLEEYGPFDVMKMDCEGCEYDAVLNSRKVAEPRQIQMEYHYGPRRLVEALRNAGFEAETTRPKIFYNPRARDPKYVSGLHIRGEGSWPTSPPSRTSLARVSLCPSPSGFKISYLLNGLMDRIPAWLSVKVE